MTLYTVVRLRDVDVEAGTNGGPTAAEGIYATRSQAAAQGAAGWEARGEYDVVPLVFYPDGEPA